MGVVFMPFYVPPSRPFYQQVDESEIVIDSITLKLNRCNTQRLPYEVSLLIPRAEIRRRYYEGGQLVKEEEVNLSGITLVHSPRYPPRRHLPGEKPGFPAPSPMLPRSAGSEEPPSPAPPPPFFAARKETNRAGRPAGAGPPRGPAPRIRIVSRQAKEGELRGDRE